MVSEGRQNTSRRRPVAAWLVALLAGCAAPPPAAVSTPFGEVRSGTHDDASALAASVRRLRPLVLATLPDSEPRRMDVWVDPTLADYDTSAEVTGFTTLSRHRILLGVTLEHASRDFVLVHEMVHAFMGPGWDPLPAIMKEGLADAVAARLVPEDAPRARAVAFIAARLALGDQELRLACEQPAFGGRTTARLSAAAGGPSRPPRDALALEGRGVRVDGDSSDEAALYGYGLLLVERIVGRAGLSGLHELCDRARAAGAETVPADWALQAAGLDGSPAGFIAALDEELRGPETEALAAYVAVELGESVASSMRWRFPDLSADEFLRAARPVLSFGASGKAVMVAGVPPLRDAVTAAWNRLAPQPLAEGRTCLRVDADGAHSGSVARTAGAHELVLEWLRVSTLTVGPGGPVTSVGECTVRLGRDAQGPYLSSTLREGFAEFRVEVLGVAVSDLRGKFNVRTTRAASGLTTLTCRLDPALDVEAAVFYGPDARLVVLQRGAADRDDLRVPVAVPWRR